MLTVLDLFSGIGGFSLGLERTGGFRTVAFCEIEPFPRKVLEKHWPNIPIFEDIRKLHAEDLPEPVDVICGGFPCQDLSSAGHHKNWDGERSSLYKEYLRIAGEIVPRFAIFENVKELVTGDDGRLFARFLYDLAEIGFDAEWFILPASFIGADHTRERAWVVAYHAGIGRDWLVPFIQKFSEEVNPQSSFRWSPDTLALLPAVGEFFNPPDSDFKRNDDGLSEGMDRLKSLGNAVVPQVVEVIGRAILEAHHAHLDQR